MAQSNELTRNPITIFSLLRKVEDNKFKTELRKIFNELKYVLPKNYKLGAAVGQGDSFFDSVAQGLNELKENGFITSDKSINAKSLRETCKQYAQNELNNSGSWLKKAIKGDCEANAKNIEEYIPRIKFTAEDVKNDTTEVKILNLENAIDGRPEIEGRIICNVHKIMIKLIELRDDEIDGLYITTSDVGESGDIVYIVNYRYYFVPLLSSIERDIEMNVAVSRAEVYGENNCEKVIQSNTEVSKEVLNDNINVMNDNTGKFNPEKNVIYFKNLAKLSQIEMCQQDYCCLHRNSRLPLFSVQSAVRPVYNAPAFNAARPVYNAPAFNAARPVYNAPAFFSSMQRIPPLSSNTVRQPYSSFHQKQKVPLSKDSTAEFHSESESKKITRNPIPIFYLLNKIEDVKLKMEFENLLSELRNVLPKNYKLGAAAGEGDSFFDSVSQGLNELMKESCVASDESFNVRSLRETCKQYAQNELNNSASWLRKAIKDDNEANISNIEEYILRVKFTAEDIKNGSSELKTLHLENAIDGRPEIEGRIICKVHKIKIKLIELRDEEIDGLHITTGEVGECSNIVYIVNYRYHFVPLLCNIKKDIENNLEVSRAEVYGKSNEDVMKSNVDVSRAEVYGYNNSEKVIESNVGASKEVFGDNTNLPMKDDIRNTDSQKNFIHYINQAKLSQNQKCQEGVCCLHRNLRKPPLVSVESGVRHNEPCQIFPILLQDPKMPLSKGSVSEFRSESESKKITRSPTPIFCLLNKIKDKKLKRELKNLLSALRNIFPKNYKFGAAAGEGDSFFDSVAQGLNELNKKSCCANDRSFNVKTLRQTCKQYAQNELKMSGSWLRKAMGDDESRAKNIEEYIAHIQFTAEDITDDSSEVKTLNLENVIDGRSEIEGQIISKVHKVKIKLIELREKVDGLYVTTGVMGESSDVVYLVNYRNHFVPLLSNIEEDIENYVDVSRVEVYGDNINPSLNEIIRNVDLDKNIVRVCHCGAIKIIPLEECDGTFFEELRNSKKQLLSPLENEVKHNDPEFCNAIKRMRLELPDNTQQSFANHHQNLNVPLFQSNRAEFHSDFNKITRNPIPIFCLIRKVDDEKSKMKIESFISEIRNVLPKNYKLGAAVGQGDSFFDSVAQGLNELREKSNIVSDNSFNVRCLRETCKQYAQSELKHAGSWLRKAIYNDEAGPENIEKYIARINLTAEDITNVGSEVKTLNLENVLHGRPKIEGRIICNVHKVKIKVLELRNEEVDRLYDIITTSDMEESSDVVYVVNYRHHFVPLLTNIERDIENDIEVSRAEVYGLNFNCNSELNFCNNSENVTDQRNYKHLSDNNF